MNAFDEEVVRKFLKGFEKSDIESFREYLTNEEERNYLAEEDKIEVMRQDLLKKYNQFVSDRLSHTILISEIQKALDCSVDKLTTMLDKMDNQTLQKILSVLMMKKSMVNEEKKI